MLTELNNQFKQEKKTVISVQTKQKILTELNNKCVKATLQTNLIQCFQCILVSVKLFLCVPCRHSEECRFSSTHWTGGWVGTRTVMGTLEYRKISSPARNQIKMPPLSNLWPINYAISAMIPASLKSCRVHTAANIITTRLKKCNQVIQHSRGLRCIR